MKKTIAKLMAAICLLSLTGCAFLPVAAVLIGSGGTIAAARVKMKGDMEKAKAIEGFRDTVIESLGEIEEKLEAPEVEARETEAP
jgi:uncharacterized OsmC-like protein|tara:strand:+ start:614 stop:868 length:255 start_codon:yes stop_codon:yes gene_type:complete